jgi:heat-inducible transcriptional repressor
MAMPSARQQLILRRVVEGYMATGAPVGSKALAVDADLGVGSSTIRNELALL